MSTTNKKVPALVGAVETANFQSDSETLFRLLNGNFATGQNTGHFQSPCVRQIGNSTAGTVSSY
jgi:hypothetical protein